MTWTYDPTNPTDRDRVRIRIGDIDVNKQTFSDETIDFWLSEAGSVISASIRLARLAAVEYAKKASVTIGPLSISFSEQAQFFNDLAATLEYDNRKLLVISPFSGTANNPEADERKTDFGLGMHDNKEAD